jgi:hypothetical protein
MNPGRATTRRLSTCLALSAVLMLGIVQWSFLPVLIQGSSMPSRTSIEISPGHSSKFAAPFKCLSAASDCLQTCLKPASLDVPLPRVLFSRPSGEPSFRHDDQFVSDRRLRSPPSA